MHFGRDRYRYDRTGARLDVLEDKYVKASWFESISSGTSGSLSLPTGGAVVLNEWRAGIDALTTKMDTGIPTFVSAEEADGTLITTTLDGDGNWALSGTPSAYPIGIVYVYKVKFIYYDSTYSLGEVEMSAGPMTVDTLKVVSGGNLAGTFITTGTINARGGEVRVQDNATSAPQGKDDGYVGVVKVGADGRLYFAVEGAMYYIKGTASSVPVTGNPIGLLLALTYKL